MDKALEIQRKVIEILGTDEVYLVGGSVRDIVMGAEPKDYDFTTSLTPDEMKPLVKAAGRRIYKIGDGEKHGTVTFKVPLDTIYFGDGYAGTPVKDYFIFVEVTTHRTEVYESSSRKPTVQFGVSLDEDLARRDFTMNAMVLRPDGTIYDPYGGKLDTHAKQIVTVGMPKDRIQEDPLRMLRAARFAARYGFKIDPNFIGKARQLADRIYDVSVERWVQELDKLLVSEHLDFGIQALEDMGLWDRIFPDIMISWLPSANSFPDNIDEVWKELFKYCDHNPKAAKFMATGLCHRFKFSNDRTDIIVGRTK